MPLSGRQCAQSSVPKRSAAQWHTSGSHSRRARKQWQMFVLQSPFLHLQPGQRFLQSGPQLQKRSQKFCPAMHTQDGLDVSHGPSWSQALAEGLVHNAVDACKVLGVDAATLNEQWAAAKEAGELFKFGGGFYVGRLSAGSTAMVTKSADVLADLPQSIYGGFDALALSNGIDDSEKARVARPRHSPPARVTRRPPPAARPLSPAPCRPPGPCDCPRLALLSSPPAHAQGGRESVSSCAALLNYPAPQPPLKNGCSRAKAEAEDGSGRCPSR